MAVWCSRETLSVDHLEIELAVVPQAPVRSFDRMTFSISEWDAEEYGGISG